MNLTFSDRIQNVKGSVIREMFKMLGDPEIISFAGGAPAPETFPCDILADISAEILREKGNIALQYGVTEGYAPMADFIRSRHTHIMKDYDRIIVTSGGNQAIDYTAKVLLNEGDTVICENPSFIGALNAFRSYGANLCGIECDNSGMDIEKLEHALKTEKNVKLIYVIPTFQNPSGITTTLERRKQILELAEKYGVMILEDNPYGDLRFDGEDVATIKSMDKTGIVAYAGTFSKTLSPGLRLGFLICNEHMMERVVVCKQVNDVHSCVLSQMICAEFFKRYDFDEHVKKIRALYRKKAHLMMDEMEKTFPDFVTWTKPEGGLFMWGTIHKNVDTMELSKEFIKNKVAVVPGCTFLDDLNKKSNSFRLNYTTMPDEKIILGVEKLAEVLKTL